MRDERPPAVQTQPAAAGEGAAPPTVLVINDDPVQLRLAGALLATERLNVRACRDGEEALRELAAGERPDLIVTDISMPGIDGWRLCRLLRSPEYAGLNDVPILVLSATFSGADAEQVSADLGADGFLSVPCPPDALRRAVRALLAGRRPAAPARALIADPDPAEAEALREAFARRGYRPLLARTQEEARRLFEEERPEAVFLADPLPDGPAEDLLRAVKRPGGRTVVAVGSGDGDPRRAFACMRLGADGFLRRPVEAEQVVALCARAAMERALLRVKEVLAERTRELRRSEGRFRALFDAVSQILFACDREGVVVHANAFGAARLEYTPAELAGTPLDELMTPESAARWSARQQTPHRPRRFEGVLVTRTGRRLEVEIEERPLEGEDGETALVVAQDVTDRRRLERALHQSEERFRFVVENAFDGISISEFDPVTGRRRLVFCNNRFAAMSGRTREELLAAPDLNAFIEMQADADEREHHYRCILDGVPFTGVGAWKRPSGPDRLFEWTAVSFRAGDRLYLVAIDRDITERRRVEEDVREALSRLDALIENTPLLAIQRFDARGRVLHWNHACVRLYGWSAEEACGRRRQDMIEGAEAARRFEAALAHVWATGQPLEGEEWPVRAKDGPLRWVHSSLFPVFRDGRVDEVFAVDVDITARKQVEREVAEVLRLHRKTLATVPSALLVLDSRLNVVMANRSFREAWGLAPGDCTGRPLGEVLDRRLLTERGLLEHICTVAALGGREEMLGVEYPSAPHGAEGRGPAGRVLNIRICGLRGDGASGPEADGGPSQEEGPFPLVLLVFDDITEQVRLEEQLRQASKLQSIGRLAGGVAHDFNNILTGISGYAQLVLSQVEPNGPLARDIGQIRELAGRASSLTRQLLAFSRRQPIEPVVLDVNRLVENLSRMLQRLIGEDVALRTVLAPDLGRVRADPGQIEQVLMNMAVNARDAMPSGGTLVIETRNVTLEAPRPGVPPDAPPGPYVRIAVTDTGVGMDRETLAHIFEPFFTTKETGRGTGLGLSMAYGIVRQHGGWIEIESEPGKGATFRIHLPCIEAPADAPQSRPPEEGAAPGSETVLLVEDEDSVRSLVERVLSQNGYAVLACSGPAEARTRMQRARAGAGGRSGGIHLLLTDVVMPGENGVALYEALRAQAPGLKVLYMSGYTDRTIVPDTLAQREDIFLQKPFTPGRLLEKVRRALDAPAPDEGTPR